MKKILNYLLEHKALSEEMAYELMLQVGKGAYSDAEIASLITIYLMRTVTTAELTGFRKALLEMAHPICFEQDDYTDMVGTGGDGKNTFNISTLSCFIVAGAGYHVAKHGNYGVSTTSGASNVMEYLGYKFKNDQAALQNELTETNITFLHAPLFHPALKHVATARKSLGLRSVFNILGPVVHPAKPTYTVLGVYHLEIARYYNYMLQASNMQYSIIHTMDGYDEISLTDDSKVITKEGEFIYSPEYLGKRTVKLADISGGQSVEDAAKIFVQVLEGKGSWSQNAVVFANAAIAIQNMTGLAYTEAFAKAIESLESGAALASFKKLMSLQK